MDVPEYTALTVVAMVAVVVLELLVWRTGVFARLRFWLAMAIVFAFQVPVDGWLTKLPAPIVRYDETQILGARFPWDIPVEDFGFGFAMVTLTIVLWERARRRRTAAAGAAQ